MISVVDIVMDPEAVDELVSFRIFLRSGSEHMFHVHNVIELSEVDDETTIRTRSAGFSAQTVLLSHEVTAVHVTRKVEE